MYQGNESDDYHNLRWLKKHKIANLINVDELNIYNEANIELESLKVVRLLQVLKIAPLRFSVSFICLILLLNLSGIISVTFFLVSAGDLE